jgi:hypothetical protein
MNSEKSCTAFVISQHVLTAKLQIIPLKLLSLFSSLLTKETNLILYIMELLKRKQVLKNGLLTFTNDTKNINELFTVSTDINKGYWIYKGVIYDDNIFNIKAAKKVKTSQLSKDTVYYISTIDEQRKHLFNLDKN